MKQNCPLMRLSNRIKDSRLNDKNEIKMEKGGTVGPSAGSSGASGGDERDSNSNLSSGHAKRDASGDEKASELARLLAEFKLDNQLLLEQKPLRGSSNSSHGNSVDELSPKREFERRRASLPSNSPQEQHPGTLRHQTSEPLLHQMNQNRELKLNDPLTTSVLNNLELLEGLGNCLDKQYKCGEIKCWKHLCEHFGVEAKTYEDFTRSQERSPTEDLFDFLKTQEPKEFTIGKLKDKLSSIERQDVQGILLEFDDETQVGSLFDSHPQVIANMAFLLDKEEKPVKDNSPLKALWEDLEIAARVCNLLNKKHTSRIRCWRHLGNKLGVRKDTLDTFSNEGEMISPTEVLIRHLGAARPSLVMADLIWALERIGRTDTFSVVEVYFPG
ncbi:uncharacterized protein LOC110048813 isoform X2 [Orbicella faveolata]|uniref:uncharacterized protein LOC110048813 isoform X2 n=1 Tax=Orbicella faveolata TaxID=48498 RepID=UPI0009E5AC1C|nr:uncharacterized protein LOC110048813 isoform X2 [Orbicella faveolata]